MASTIETYLAEVKKHRKNLDSLVNKLEHAEDESAAQRISDSCAKEVTACQKYMKMAKDEIAALSDSKQQDEYDQKRKQQKKKFKKLENKFKELDNHARDRQVLMSTTGSESKRRDRTNKDYREDGLAITGRTTDRLRDALHTVNETEQIAIATAEQVVEQGEQIGRVQNTVQEIDQDLNRADKLITQFMKRLYTDKIILALACLVFCAIAFIIIYSTFIEPDQTTFTVPDAVKPPDPNTVKNTVSRRLLRGPAAVST